VACRFAAVATIDRSRSMLLVYLLAALLKEAADRPASVAITVIA
jgi:hypothetical protein